MTNPDASHKIVIREATIEDIPTIIELNLTGILSWASEFRPQIQEWMDSVCTPEHFEEMVLNPDKTLLVAELNGEVCGTAYGYPRGRKYYFGGLYVSVTGKGVATALMSGIIRKARRSNFYELTSEIYTPNEHAQHFFRRNGWVHRSVDLYNGVPFTTRSLIL